ncbi:DNA-binding protein [Neobacillus drentensis]|uniref:DNA-binding protein n=1 Tax=Neobacillus drentensis TaxID=220684 RepID=UPI003002968C
MFEIKMDESQLKALYLEEVQRHLEKIELDTMIMDSKQLCKTLNLSWPTIEKLFLHDPNFPSIRIGKKWAFNRREVQEFIDLWFDEVRQRGGMVNN